MPAGSAVRTCRLCPGVVPGRKDPPVLTFLPAEFLLDNTHLSEAKGTRLC